MYPRCILLLVFAYHVVTGLSLPATSYDQRQTGDLNVQVHLKDVQVLALLDSELLDDYTEYDYFYDYADFTVKPIVKPTTSTTTATTEATLSTSELPNASSTIEETNVSSSVDADQTNETLAIVSNEDSKNSTNEDNTLKTRINDKTRNLFEDDQDPTKESGGESSTDNSFKRLSRKRCRSGYSPDGKGRCRRLSQRKLSLIPLAMRLAPKLLDDLARSTKNLAQGEVDQMHSSRAVP